MLRGKSGHGQATRGIGGGGEAASLEPATAFLLFCIEQILNDDVVQTPALPSLSLLGVGGGGGTFLESERSKKSGGEVGGAQAERRRGAEG